MVGFKLHFVINHQAGIVVFKLTLGNIDDRKPVPKMLQGMKNGFQLFTKVKKKNKLISLVDKIMPKNEL